MDFTPYVGLARNPDDCDGTVPDGVVNETEHTLVYLDDIPELPLARLSGASSWDVRNTARRTASQMLDTDLKAFLGQAFPARPLGSGLLGKASYTNFPPIASQLVSFPLHSHYLKGGKARINSLGMILSEPVTNQVIELWRVGDTAPLKTVTLAHINARTTTQYSLADWVFDLDGSQYEIRTTLPEGIKVADNPMACNSCGGLQPIRSILSSCCSGKASGFMMNLSGLCSYDPLLQQLMENERTSRVLAYMLAYQTGYTLCVKPVSGEIERSTVLSETDLSNAAGSCRQEYLNRLGWLKSEVSKLGLSVENTCFQANTPTGWSRGRFAY
ncbi:hypothetical protein GGR92_005214 [Spirosoma lacussanchae]|uniref:hypothetical protein n=1 Tax=Spirosoma lacussanchae TaxID=1884249 RepID=UPI0011092A30|nr:hypothetical protein [Spirosoma lacussanchae]